MSIEIFALSDRRLTSMDQWQRAIDSERSDLALPTGTSIDELNGFLPVRWNAMSTGFECSHYPGHVVTESSRRADFDFGRKWLHAIAFYTQNFEEHTAALIAAAAYAKATDGVVFDPQNSALMSPQGAFEFADYMEANIPRMKEAVRTAVSELRRKNSST